MRFVNGEKPRATVSMYASLALVFIAGLIGMDSLVKWAILPTEYTVQVGSTPGRTFIEKEVTPGTFKIAVPWEATQSWGDDAITSIWIDSDMTKLEAESWRPDPVTAGVFQYSMKSVDVPYGFCIGWAPINLSSGTITLERRLSKANIYVLVIGMGVAAFLALMSFADINGQI